MNYFYHSYVFFIDWHTEWASFSHGISAKRTFIHKQVCVLPLESQHFDV